MKINKMNQYLSNLAVFNIKLHNLHWNVKGLQFMAIHNFTEELYNVFFLQYDDLVELIKIKGENPLASMKDYLAHASIKESNKDTFTVKEVIEILIKDLSLLKKEAIEIRALANETDDFEVVSMFEEYIPELDKNLWFLNSMNV
ncbi:DNA starvation/stationary phase protection protein [Acidaminobacter sp. JC074]|uniref:Dps family protein n=1 Tax=Acidaminobacter sp. JC074 TaxID=2530199 RepID=UPI001F0E232F|nr:DNA starvation/stationary phase protection protein [Acidaminobacter sp. JC074]MCH4891047.1 DNA starvation/stationary phase protection protein [Acidaminobacter sp. JC074]